MSPAWCLDAGWNIPANKAALLGWCQEKEGFAFLCVHCCVFFFPNLDKAINVSESSRFCEPQSRVMFLIKYAKEALIISKPSEIIEKQNQLKDNVIQ